MRGLNSVEQFLRRFRRFEAELHPRLSVEQHPRRYEVSQLCTRCRVDQQTNFERVLCGGVSTPPPLRKRQGLPLCTIQKTSNSSSRQRRQKANKFFVKAKLLK